MPKSSRLFYINNYYTDDICERYPIPGLATINKIKYFHKVMGRIYLNFTNVSFGFASKKGFHRSIKTKSSDGIDLSFLSCVTFRDTDKFNLISILWANYVLFFFILFNVRSKDRVIVYHYAWLMPVILISKLLKRYELILEIEELYWTNENLDKRVSKIYKFCENTLFRLSDKYIVVNRIIEQRLRKRKPLILCYGNYEIIPQIYNKANKNDCNDPVRLLYSGSIDEVRGVFEAVKSIKYVNYPVILYITGYGKEKYIRRLKKEIQKVEKTLPKSRIIFSGALETQEYDDLIRKVDICLNCQLVNNQFANFSFPSKIIKYLSYGKYVVSSKMPSVVESPFKRYIHFYSDDSGMGIATAINKLIQGWDQKNKINKEAAEYIKLLDDDTVSKFEQLVFK